MASLGSRAALMVMIGSIVAPTTTLRAQLSPTAALDRAAKAYAHDSTARGTFEQTVDNPLTGRSAVATAEFQQERPSRLAVRYTNPAGDRVVADGKWVWVYLPSATPDQVVRVPLSDNRGTPAGGAVSLDFISQFLTDPASRFTISGGGMDTIAGHPSTVVMLVARDSDDQITHAKLWIDDADGIVRQFETTDPSSTVRRFRILSESFNVPVDRSAFKFSPPHGVKIVDQSQLVNGTD
jgi:outer membrane lipoprotein carrier protein